MPDPLPPPPIPATIDLRNFQDMPLEVARVRDSDLRRRSSGDEFKAAIILWCAAWHQKPAGSLPNDDVELADLACYGSGKPAVRSWLKVKTMAMRGWFLASDGRWYHHRLASKVLIAWRAKEANRDRTLKARLASLAKAMGMEQDPTRLAILRIEHDKLLSELSHPLSQAPSPPPVTPAKGSDQEGSEGIKRDRIGRDNSLSSPPSPSAPPQDSTAASDGGAKASPMGDGERKTEKPLSRRAQGMNAAALRLAVTAGNVLAILQVYGCPVEGDLAGEWRRDTDGLQVGEIVAVLAWQKALKNPIRLPSGWRRALETWRELKFETRQQLAQAHTAGLGIETGINDHQETSP